MSRGFFCCHAFKLVNRRVKGCLNVRRSERFQLLVKAAPVRYKAIWLLMANTACGSTDICELRLHEIDLETGWYIKPRTKNDIDRRVKL